MRRLLMAVAIAAALADTGCLIDAGGTLTDDSMPPPPSPDPQRTDPAVGSKTPPDVDVPGDVRAVMETYCAPCHSGNMYVYPFTTREDLLGPHGDAGTLGDYAAQLVMTEMMPPKYAAGALPTAADRAV